MDERTLAEQVGAEPQVGYVCRDCEDVVPDDQDFEPLYECASCGMRFTRDQSADGASHRCPECFKYAALVSHFGCPECGEGELEQVMVICCPLCEDYVEQADFDDHWARAGHKEEVSRG